MENLGTSKDEALTGGSLSATLPYTRGRNLRDTMYGYIIVGAGIASNVVAAGPTDNSSANATILQAGSFYELTSGNWSLMLCFSEKFRDSAEEGYSPFISPGPEIVP